MIYGIGCDICDIRRIRAALNRHGERFAARILNEAELALWRTRTSKLAERGVRYLATRFSAKESFSKALGLGMRRPISWRLCEISNAPSGKPILILHGALKEWFEVEGLRAQLSLSDETDYAVSFVVVERN